LPNAADLWGVIQRYSRYLVISHVRPDLDAVGSEIAMAAFLATTGKEARIVNDDVTPEAYRFLPHWEKISAYPAGMDFDYEAVICLDAPDLARTGVVGANVKDVPTIIVDHHPYENKMADFAWIDAKGSATGQMLYSFMRYRRELIGADVAACLYAAIMADTGRFTYANTTQKTLEAAADLMALGADAHTIAEAYYENVPDGQMYLMGQAAVKMRRAAGGRLAYTVLAAEDFERAGAGPEAAQELAELPRSLKGVLIGALLRDIGGKTKVSLRGRAGVDVKKVAEHFGGGGHREASGFLLELPLAEAEIVVIGYMEQYLDKWPA
jgi:bifunctional oligoribonuclease and PAP phosphatase NrnA